MILTYCNIGASASQPACHTIIVIGCICLSFLLCGFSNVFLNHLPEWVHNHIGCICLTFPHCGFSNESSNLFFERMHSYTCCICLTFLHCGFSNEPSNCLLEKIHSYTGCICPPPFFEVFVNFLVKNRFFWTKKNKGMKSIRSPLPLKMKKSFILQRMSSLNGSWVFLPI